MISFFPWFSVLLGENSIWCEMSSVGSSYRTICSRVLPFLWGRAGWIFLWISAGVSLLLYTAQPILGRVGSSRRWQTVKNFLPLGKPWPFSDKFVGTVEKRKWPMYTLKCRIELWVQIRSLLVLLSFTYKFEEMVLPLCDCGTLPMVPKFSGNKEYMK